MATAIFPASTGSAFSAYRPSINAHVDILPSGSSCASGSGPGSSSKKIQVVRLNIKPRLQSPSSKDLSTHLLASVAPILNGQSPAQSYQYLSSACRTLVLPPNALAPTIYSRVREELEHSVGALAREWRGYILGRGQGWLSYLVQGWTIWEGRVALLCAVFTYLDRVYSNGSTGIFPIMDVAIATFRKGIWENELLFQKTRDDVLSWAAGERSKAAPDVEARPTVVAIMALAKLLSQSSSLSAPYLESTTSHYSGETRSRLGDVEGGKTTPSAYVEWALAKIVEEKERAALCLDEAVAEGVAEIVRAEVGAKLTHAALDEAMDLADSPAVDRLYHLSVDVEVFDRFSNSLRDYIEARLKKLISDPANDPRMIEETLTLKRFIDRSIRSLFAPTTETVTSDAAPEVVLDDEADSPKAEQASQPLMSPRASRSGGARGAVDAGGDVDHEVEEESEHIPGISAKAGTRLLDRLRSLDQYQALPPSEQPPSEQPPSEQLARRHLPTILQSRKAAPVLQRVDRDAGPGSASGAGGSNDHGGGAGLGETNELELTPPDRARFLDLQDSTRIGFKLGLGSRQNAPAEWIAKHLDHVMRRGQGSGTEAAFNALLDEIIALIGYTRDKDVFKAFYSTQLAKRLLLSKSASDDMERNMIVKLQNEMGEEFTSGDVMMKDLQLSENMIKTYQSHLSKSSTPDATSLSANVLTESAWPAYPLLKDGWAFKLPPELQRSVDDFTAWYATQHKNRQLSWRWQLATVSLTARFGKAKYEVGVSLFQAVVLMLFNDEEELGFEEIKARTGIETSELVRTLQSLALGRKGTRVLTKRPPVKTVLPTDIFAYNTSFTSERIKFKINQIQQDMSAEESAKTNEQVAVDRVSVLEATIVRIMKGRKKLSLQLLIDAVVGDVSRRFPPDVREIKKRVESLIEREFLMRDEDDRNMLVYLA